MSRSLVESVIRHLWPEEGDKPQKAPADVCVNCWGHFEYDGQIRTALRDRQIDVNNKQQRYAFIEEFTVKHIDGIRLKSKDGELYCPQCAGARS